MLPVVNVLLNDERFIVVDKPAGVATHRGWDASEDALLQRVRDMCGSWVFPIHRLDKGASGCVVMAKDRETASLLGQAFAAREVEKTYWAICRGHPPLDIELDHPLANETGTQRLPATTHIRRLETFGRYALVEARPTTGRLHQIRRHLKHLSCPLIGDSNYGKSEHNRIFRDVHGLSRLALHAIQISFTHPISGLAISVNAPVPHDFGNALESCRRHYSETT